jgi:hypothetical protein
VRFGNTGAARFVAEGLTASKTRIRYAIGSERRAK